jgi:hypothetical protein
MNKQPYEQFLASIDLNPDYTPYARLLTRLVFDPTLSKGSRKLITVPMAFYHKTKGGFPSISELTHESGYTETHIYRLLAKPSTQK